MIIMSDNIELNATLEKPEGVSKCPLCFIIHGFTGNSEERHLMAVAETMRKNGIATLRVDMYGHGKSGGRFEDHTLYKWLTNGIDVIDYIRTLDFVTDIYLCGHSQGALTAILLASMERDTVKKLFALSPASMIPDEARAGTTLGISYDPVNLPPSIPIWNDLDLNSNYIRVAQTIDVDAAIQRIGIDVFIAIGSEDKTVAPAYAKATAKKFSLCKYVEIPGDTHCFDNNLEEMISELDSYLKTV